MQQSFKLFIHLRLMRWVRGKFFHSIFFSSPQLLKNAKVNFLLFRSARVSPSFLIFFSFCLLQIARSLHHSTHKWWCGGGWMWAPCGIDGWTEHKSKHYEQTSQESTNTQSPEHLWIVNQSKNYSNLILTRTWAACREKWAWINFNFTLSHRCHSSFKWALIKWRFRGI